MSNEIIENNQKAEAIPAGESRTYLEVPSDARIKSAFRVADVNTSYVLVAAFALQSMWLFGRVLIGSAPISSISIAIGTVLSIWLLRLLSVFRKAFVNQKSNYVIEGGLLCASGLFEKNNWRLKLENIEHATIKRYKDGGQEIHLSTKKSTFIVFGLENPETLWKALPERLTSSADLRLHERIEQALDVSADGEELSESKKHELITQQLEQNGQSRLLVPDRKAAITHNYFEMYITALVLIFGALYSPSYIGLILAAIIITARSLMLRLEKSTNCLYALTSQGLMEIDHKRGVIETMPYHKLKQHKSFLDSRSDLIDLPGYVSVPVTNDDQSLKQLCARCKDRHVVY